MKRLFTAALSALLLFGLAACQPGHTTSGQPGGATSAGASPLSSAPNNTTETTGIPPLPASSPAGETETPKVLIAYFSRTGHTEQIAEMIHRQNGGKLFRIETQQPYADDYDAVLAQAQREQRENARPALAAAVERMEDYDIVFIGYPIWWGDTPMAVLTFLENTDFSGKTVIPFCTSGSSSPQASFDRIKNTLPRAGSAAGFWVRGADAAQAGGEVNDWLNSLDLPGR